MRYGIGYKGSKSRIAEDIISVLPSGKRFIDLFGGGGAISHCASLSHKYEEVVYSDVDVSISSLVYNVFNNAYDNDTSIFEWVSRERFKREKESNPIIKWCWSFGNNGLDYLYSKQIERQKEAIHKAIVNKEYSDLFLSLTNSIIPFTHDDITRRRLEWAEFCRNTFHKTDDYRVPSIERLETLSYYNSTGEYNKPVCLTRSYTEYEYQEGDIVYCDPPYSNKRQDSYKGFDSKSFYEWARHIPCYISEYSAPDDFECVWEKKISKSINRVNMLSESAVERLFKSPCKI